LRSAGHCRRAEVWQKFRFGRAIWLCAATAFIRLERTGLAEGPGENWLAMRLETSLYLGERWEYLPSRGALHVRAWGRAPLPPGERWVEFPPGDLWLF